MAEEPPTPKATRRATKPQAKGLAHPTCREGADLLPLIDPHVSRPPKYFTRLFQRGRALLASPNGRHFESGLLLIGLAGLAAMETGFTDAL
jgi:hypothetical protein